MTPASVPRLAAAAWLTTLALLLATGVVVGLGTDPDVASLLDALLFGAVMQGMATLGALIARREPRNPIGWIFCAVPGLVAVAIAAGTYAVWADDHRPGALGAGAADWLSSWTWVAGLAAYALLVPLLFPDGRPPGPRWRHVVRADLVTIAWIAVLAGGTDSPPQPVVVATAVLVAVLIAVGLASAVVRYRRADAIQRVQIRECLFAAWAAFVGFFAISVLAPYEALYALDYALLPLSVGLAMLRYRLYDVDVIIRKTLVYGVSWPRWPGLRRGSDAHGRAPAQPHRLVRHGCCDRLDTRGGGRLPADARRIQRIVDRRFYRSGYDAQAAMDAFSGRLREEIDLDALRIEFLDAVTHAVHPTHSTLWLRPHLITDGPSAAPERHE